MGLFGASRSGPDWSTKLKAMTLGGIGLVAITLVPGGPSIITPARAVLPVVDASANVGIITQITKMVYQIGQVTQIITQVTQVINFASGILTNSRNIFGAIGSVGALASMAGYQEVGGVNPGEVKALGDSVNKLMNSGQRLEGSINTIQNSMQRLEGNYGTSMAQLTRNPLGQSFAGTNVPMFDRIADDTHGLVGELDAAVTAEMWTRRKLGFNGTGGDYQAISRARIAEAEAAALDGFGLGSFQMVVAGRADERMKTLLDSVQKSNNDTGNLRGAVATETTVLLAILEELSQMRATEAAQLRLMSAQALAARGPGSMGANFQAGTVSGSGP